MSQKPRKSEKERARDLAAGVIDYFRDPKLKDGFGAFNQQEHRKKIFLDLIKKIDFGMIVETGTFRGATAEYMQKMSSVPIYTTELSARYYAYAKTKYLFNSKIKIYNMDSRKFLRQLSMDSARLQNPAFFYLDAHWLEDLPLYEETDIIFHKWHHPVIMIDDFKVPLSDGYGYDAYGPGKALCLDLLTPLRQINVQVYFPSVKAELETGFKRGCVVLAKSKGLIEKLNRMDSLVPYPWEA